jgi:hypothetical protein
MKKFGGVNTGSNACKSALRLKTNQVESEVYKCVFVQKPLDALLPWCRRLSETFAAMLPRISLRRSFLYLLGITCFLFLAVNVHQRELWARSQLVAEMAPGGAAPPHSGAGSRGSVGSELADHVVIGNSNRLGQAIDEEDPSAKEQENIDEDRVNNFAGKCLLLLGVATGQHLTQPVRWRSAVLIRRCRNSYVL